MIAGVANIWMPVEDVERAKDFYRDTLELPVAKDDGDWVEFDANGVRIGLNGRESGGTRSEGGPVLTLQPEQGLDTAVSELEGRGVHFPPGSPSTRGGGWRRSRTPRATTYSSTSRRSAEPWLTPGGTRAKRA